MASKTVLVLGAAGMLGNALFRTFSGTSGWQVVGTIRSPSQLAYFAPDRRSDILTGIDVLDGDALVSLLERIRPAAIVNCVGLIKQLAAAKDPLVALPINALFPHRLARLAALTGTRVVHVSTDCVFSGSSGGYTEESAPDATDLYGVSKRLGELVDYPHAVTVRTSIIGRELSSAHSLIDWFLAQSGTVRGYSRAIFSGLPTCKLAAIIRDFVLPAAGLHGLYHVSAQPISKLELLRLVGRQYGRDTEIFPDDSVVIDRSLNSTRFTEATGYVAPTWPTLIERMHSHDTRRTEQRV